MLGLLEGGDQKSPMDFLLLRALNQYPAELSRMIRGFILRPDWRTCKVKESNLIKDYNLWTKRVLNDDALDWYDSRIKMEFPIVFSQKELSIYLDWSLFGRWFLIQRTKKNNYWYSFTRCIEIKDYKSWYMRTFHDLHNEWRRIH
jgi:hypothetical protein